MKAMTLMVLLLGMSPHPYADHQETDLTPDMKRGRTLYRTTCIACHGAGGKGAIPGAPNFTTHDSRLITKDTSTRVHHVDRGFQSSGSPMAMLPKGSNPSSSTQDIVDIVSYMRKQFTPEQATISNTGSP